MKAYASNRTEYTAWVREVAVEVDNKTYYGTLLFENWTGYDWDGEEIPGIEMDQKWFYELDSLTGNCERCQHTSDLVYMLGIACGVK